MSEKQKFLDMAAMMTMQGILADDSSVCEDKLAKYAYDIAEVLWAERERRYETKEPKEG